MGKSIYFHSRARAKTAIFYYYYNIINLISLYILKLFVHGIKHNFWQEINVKSQKTDLFISVLFLLDLVVCSSQSVYSHHYVELHKDTEVFLLLAKSILYFMFGYIYILLIKSSLSVCFFNLRTFFSNTEEHIHNTVI